MRFSETEFTSPGQLDFVPRERRSQIWKVIVAFSIAIALIFILAFASGKDNKTMAAFGSMAVVGLLCFYVVYRKQQNLDLVMATEYQNMLFSQAVGLGSSFVLFVRRDGTIVYANEGLRKLFPQAAYSESQALEGIFDQGAVRKQDRERIMAAIYSSQGDRLIFPMRTGDGEEKDYILTVEALARPGGFLIIRGREYRDQRAGMQMLPDVLRVTSADKIDHMLASTPVAHYVTDAFGRFEYVNPAMELLLGYNGGEITDSKLSLHHILYQLQGQPVGEDYRLADYAGEALLQKKQGTLANVMISQKTIRDGQGKMLGVTGSIIPHAGA